MINFHSPIKIWKRKNRIIIKIELVNVLLSVSPERQPKQYERLLKLLEGGEPPPFITYDDKQYD